VVSHLYRETAAGRPGVITRVGLGTFVDPHGRRSLERGVDGGSGAGRRVRRQEFLFYPRRPIDVALLRGTTADEQGNVTMEREAATVDTLSIAQRRRTRVGS
jgi:propionate CoA-transferase